jgi:hypothetical protein
MTKLTLRDLEAMRQHYGIAHEQPQAAGAADSRRVDELLEDLGQVGRLEEVGIRLERWGAAERFSDGVRRGLTGVPRPVGGGREEEQEEANREGHRAVSRAK